MIQLSASFVPATDDMKHLQTYGADADFFHRFDQDGHYAHGKGPYGTEQGYYAVTPSGKLLGSTNKRDPAIVAGILRDALAKYAQLPKPARLMAERDASRPRDTTRAEAALYPDGGLVLLEYVRDLPEPGQDASKVNGNWNLDHAWFTPGEAESLVPRRGTVGAKVRWSLDLSTRLARFHLIDTVNGLRYSQRPMFGDGDVRDAVFTSEIEAVEGQQVKLRITGRTLARSDTPRARGMRLSVLGHATWDGVQKRFTAFKLVALGRRWGGTGEGKSYDRAGEKGPRPIGFTFALAGDTAADRVPPMYLQAYGW